MFSIDGQEAYATNLVSAVGSKVLQSRLSLCVIAISIFEAVVDRVLEATYVLKDSHLFPEFQDFLHWFKTIMDQWSDSCYLLL